MIRITFLLRRKPELSQVDFQEYWLNEQHRLVLIVAYNMAYLLNPDAPELYERARAERRAKR